ncbi:sorting nexin-15-like [Pollicipes pollicipes]|uniref:sorting nexin-15-like n=1 Tax=Pollicipes pollicipes TaxID=41117 RepID=UPI00188586A0|nr:sorting nexin-15-like [Pollicipes pollicipes]
MNQPGMKKDGWVRIFEVPCFEKHEKGYTIYKITSKVFPCLSPEASTQVTVWKRYNEFRKLHKEMESLHSALYLKGTFPSLPKTSYFNRFEAPVVEERQASIRAMLEFVAQHPPLFASASFAKFFEDGDCRAVNEADRLPAALIPRPLSPAASLGSSQTGSDVITPPSGALPYPGEPPPYPAPPAVTDSLASLDPLAPDGAVDGTSNLQLLSGPPQPDLLRDLDRAQQAEAQCLWQLAFNQYQEGIGTLINGVQGDPSQERRAAVRRKTAMYISRAEQLCQLLDGQETADTPQVAAGSPPTRSSD